MNQKVSRYPLVADDSLPRLRLRRASLADAARLVGLASSGSQGNLSVEELSDRIEHGGALYYEGDAGPVSLISWNDSAGGWNLAECATVEGEDSLGHTRWLMTEVEALAIRLNVPRLSVTTPADDTLASAYRRMGYEEDADGSGRLSKRVGGQWQYRGQGAGA